MLIGDTIFTSPNGDGTAILRGHPSHAKVSPVGVQREYLHFSVILRPSVMVRPRESNPRPPALQSSALPTELILPRLRLFSSEMITVKRHDVLDICFAFLGVMFKLDKENLHESLDLVSGNLTVKQSSMVHANVFGTAFLADGRHFWTVKIDSFKGENSFMAVG